jgi:23S rRNA (guanosine2251-2'-O)-methyltransferase
MDELQRMSVDAFKNADKTPIVVVLDNVRSMNNVGSVFRTADAFALEAIYLCGVSPQPPHRDINKTALGATETVSWYFTNTTLEAINLLRQEGFKIIGIEQAHNSIPLQQFNISKAEKYALILGNEVSGVADDVIQACDVILEIPQGGSKHSLNISVSAGIVAWQFYNYLSLQK